MNRIDHTFDKLKERGEKALIAYLTLGFPSLETNYRQILEMAGRGVTAVEIGIPFTDPTADGPTIQASSQKSLARGTTAQDAFILARRIRTSSEIPLLLMGYLNPFLALGAKKLAKHMASSGIDGLIIPDLPPEEASRLKNELDKRELRLVFLVAPTTPRKRIRLVAQISGGFVYCVSRAGVTGGKTRMAGALKTLVSEIKRYTATPVCVGFGISDRRQLEAVWRIADGAIVGSALIKPFLEERTITRGLSESTALLDRLLKP